jgi:3-oxoadipate enol-lactonase
MGTLRVIFAGSAPSASIHVAAENDAPAYIEATRSMLGWDVTARLAEIAGPVLIIASDQDYGPVAAKEAYRQLLPHARLVVIPDAHHAVNMELPEAFNAVLGEFLAEQARRY